MSRLARNPIQFSEGVSVHKDGDFLIFKGPKGERRLKVLAGVVVKMEKDSLTIKREGSIKQARANTGTMVALTKNAILGVSQGFEKVLEIEGIGYRASLEGKTLVLALGYVKPVRFEPPEGATIAVDKNTIKISGVDKEVVGQVAAQIRAFKKPEPYKGKGIHYKGEVIRRKAGKKATTTGAAA